MVRTRVQLTEEQAAALRTLATARRVSVAELIRGCVDRFLLAGAESHGAEKTRRALAAVGRHRSGRSDVSTHHDQHLDDTYRR
jgi:hypothetical protein